MNHRLPVVVRCGSIRVATRACGCGHYAELMVQYFYEPTSLRASPPDYDE